MGNRKPAQGGSARFTAIWRRIVRAPVAAPILFWAISLALFIINGWDVIGVGGDMPWDASWYTRITRDGYVFDGDYSVQQNIAFFPLHPAVVAGVYRLTGMTLGHAQLFSCAAMTLGACLLFHRVLLHEFGEPVAKMSVGLWVANPFAIYLFNGYSEASFVLCIAAFFYFLLVRPRMHWVVVALIAASLARPYGIFLSTIFFLYVLRQWRRGRDPAWQKVLLIHVPLTVSGYVLWCLYCDIRFDDPMASLHAAGAWRGAINRLSFQGYMTLEAPLKAFRRFWTAEHLLDSVALGSTLFFGGFFLFLAFSRRFSMTLALYGLLLPLLVFRVAGGLAGVYNSGRYELPYIVHFTALAMLLLAFDRRFVRLGEVPPDSQSVSGKVPPGKVSPDSQEPIPMAFYPVYLLFLAGFIRYTHYFFHSIWVS